MDRHAKKQEKKRKSREAAKRKALAAAARKPSERELLIRAAARGDFGPCFISAGWDDEASPELVTVIVTRHLRGELVPGIALVDRTCLGVKNAFVEDPMSPDELADLVQHVGFAHDGMLACELSTAQSIVFHAIDYARSLGFEPHRDFPEAIFGPRPNVLSSTPWSAPERPIYMAGPQDDVLAITRRLTQAVGAEGFAQISEPPYGDDDDLDDDDPIDDEEDPVIVQSPLECTVANEGTSLRICIYRGVEEVTWILEIEDHHGGSTVWEDRFDTDAAALAAAKQAIAEEGLEAFVMPRS